MSQVNLFRIQETRETAFIKFIEGQYKVIAESTVSGFKFKLLWQEATGNQDVNWGWVFTLFGQPAGKMVKMPKGIMVVQRTDTTGRTYAISFGGAHFHVDAYCDHDFGFDFACRVAVRHTKLTSTVNNNSKRNKTISSFKNFDHMEINSGESYTKLKLDVDLGTYSGIANSIIEVGSSIKIILKEDSFDNLIELVKYVEQALASAKLTRIPVCNLVSKQEEIDVLEESLKKDFPKEGSTVTISEFDIIGVEEVFVRADSFDLLCGRYSRHASSLDINELRAFFSENGIDDVDTMLKTRVRFLVNGNSSVTKSIRNFIDYLDEASNALLVCGKWYRFNTDFCQCLKESLEDIKVTHESRFDLSMGQLGKFWDGKNQEHKDDEEYKGLSEDERRAAICKRYYKEYAFNLMRGNEGYEVCDRKMVEVRGEKIEICDLRKDGVIYSVKRGNSSADLSYVVTQSEAAIDLYVNQGLPKKDKPQKVALWLILSRKDRLAIKDERLDWDMLGMLLLKIRIDSWKKKARLAGMIPEILINYEVA